MPDLMTDDERMDVLAQVVSILTHVSSGVFDTQDKRKLAAISERLTRDGVARRDAARQASGA